MPILGPFSLWVLRELGLIHRILLVAIVGAHGFPEGLGIWGFGIFARALGLALGFQGLGLQGFRVLGFRGLVI